MVKVCQKQTKINRKTIQYIGRSENRTASREYEHRIRFKKNPKLQKFEHISNSYPEIPTWRVKRRSQPTDG